MSRVTRFLNLSAQYKTSLERAWNWLEGTPRRVSADIKEVI